MATKNDKQKRTLQHPILERIPTNQQEWSYFQKESTAVQTGSFTPTFGGFSADPSTPTVYWIKEGNWVTLRFSFTTGTSNATTFTITNLPARLGCQEARSVLVHGGATDNGSASAAVVFAVIPAYAESGSTTITFGLGPDNAAGGGWTGANAKGFTAADTYCSYPVYTQ